MLHNAETPCCQLKKDIVDKTVRIIVTSGGEELPTTMRQTPMGGTNEKTDSDTLPWGGFCASGYNGSRHRACGYARYRQAARQAHLRRLARHAGLCSTRRQGPHGRLRCGYMSRGR